MPLHLDGPVASELIADVLALFLREMHGAGMHPPDFSLMHHLSDWPACWLEVRCPCSPRVGMLSVRLLLQRGDRLFGDVLAALRCSACRGKPAPVYGPCV